MGGVSLEFNDPKEIQTVQSVYIAGKITGEDPEEYILKFKVAEAYYKGLGLKVMNPAILPEGFDHGDYMPICYTMIDPCDAVVFLRDYHASKGAMMELAYAHEKKKSVFRHDEIIAQDMLDQLVDLRQEKKNDMCGNPEHDSVYTRDFIALDCAVAMLKNRI